jgi:hypothetical protein
MNGESLRVTEILVVYQNEYVHWTIYICAVGHKRPKIHEKRSDIMVPVALVFKWGSILLCV